MPSTSTLTRPAPYLAPLLAIVASALRRGDLEYRPHHRPAIVARLRETSAALQEMAVDLLRASQAINDAAHVGAVRTAVDTALEVVERVGWQIAGQES